MYINSIHDLLKEKNREGIHTICKIEEELMSILIGERQESKEGISSFVIHKKKSW